MSRDRIERFADRIASDWAWRSRELVSHHLLFSSVDDHQEKVLGRLGVLLLYSHWEGFIKNTVKEYLKIFSHHRIDGAPLHIQSAIFLQYLVSRQISVVNYNLACESVDVLTKKELTATKSIHKIVGVKSNLNVEMMKHLMDIVDIDYSFFELKANYIDKEFVGLRNAIAHGEFREVAKKDYEQIKEMVIDVIDKFKALVVASAENCILDHG